MDRRDISLIKIPVKMLFLTNKGLITISIFLSLFLLCSAQTDFGYPEDSHESSDKRNKDVSISHTLFFNNNFFWDQMLSGSNHIKNYHFIQ